MTDQKRYPSLDGGRAEAMLRTQLGREVTRMFHIWNDPYKAPETQLEEGQESIRRMAELVDQAYTAHAAAVREISEGSRPSPHQQAREPAGG